MTDRIAVLITQWAEPEGDCLPYRLDAAARTAGERALAPGEPWTVGTFPFASTMGMVPFAICWPVPGMEQLHDSFGFYRLVDGAYVNVADPSVRLPAPQETTPAVDFPRPPGRSFWGTDPRDGSDALEGIVMIAGPSGVRDLDEQVVLAAMTDMAILSRRTEPMLNPTIKGINARVGDLLRDWFGDRVQVRVGSYAQGLMPRQDVVACELASEGFTRFVLSRETTDNNAFANDFMTGNHLRRAWAAAGHSGLEVEQVRQVGRTPEYAFGLAHTLSDALQEVPPDQPVAVLYTTYGLPWPTKGSEGPFAAPHPWSDEPYHENAYLNFRHARAAIDAWSERPLSWQRPGTGESALRHDSYFSYAMYPGADFEHEGVEHPYRSLRQNLELAKADGHTEVVCLLSHWVDDCRDTRIAIRRIQGLPLNRREDEEAGDFRRTWWEEVGSSEVFDEPGPGRVRITVSAAFDRVSGVFAAGYAARLRGGVERFGEVPAVPSWSVTARGPVTRAAGGSVHDPSGASLAVPAARPRPEGLWLTDDPGDALLGAWCDTELWIGTCDAPPCPGEPVSPVVMVGPHRTITNQPMVLRLPVSQPGARAFVWNEASTSWDPLLGAHRDVDGGLEVEVQCTGVFAAGVVPEGWRPSLAPVPAGLGQLCAPCKADHACPGAWACDPRRWAAQLPG